MSELVLVVNGEELSVPEGSSIADVVARFSDDPAGRGIAVAVDRCVVPRSEWPLTAIRAGSRIEVVTAAAGG